MARLSQSKFEMLTQRVVFDHEILTHRVVARSFKVDTMTAKRLLADFVERSEGRAHATYVVTGYIDAAPPAQAAQGELGQIRALGLANGVVSSSNENSTPSGGPATDANGDAQMAEDGLPPVPSSAPEAGSSSQAYMTELKTKPEAPINEISAIMLVPQEDLEDKLALFTRILSQEVYSIEPSKLPDLVLLTDANAPVLKDKDLASVGPDVLGTIKHYRQTIKKDGKSAKASTSASTSSAAAKAKPSDKEKEKEKAKMSASTGKPDLKRKASNVESETQSKSKSATSSKAASPAVSTAKANDQSGKGKGKETSTSKLSGPSLDDLFKTDVGGKTSPAAQTSKKTSKGSSKKVAEDDEFDDMLVDDDDVMAELDALDKPKNSTTAASDKPKAEKAKVQKPTLQSNRVRKTRKVKKKVVETNAKGFKVTKEVETEEEYTASESEDEGPVVASTSAASKAAKQAKDTKAAEKEKAKEKEKEKSQKEKPKEDKKPPLARSGSSGSMAKKPPPSGQTSLAGFFSKPKPKK